VSRAGKIAWVVVGVLVVAFLLQRMIAPADSDQDEITYPEFVERVGVAGEVASVEIDEYQGELEVTPGPRSDETDLYEVGYVTDGGESLVALLDENGIPYEVRSGGGGSVARWSLYLLPLLLFGAFWYWLARRLDRLDSARG
jgi:hypothetical protein